MRTECQRVCNRCHWHEEQAKKVGLVHDTGHAQKCVLCDVMGEPGKTMKAARPTVSVRRPTVGKKYDVKVQAHPFVTGAQIDQACNTCHRAGVPRLPSRIGKQAFSHATHLGPDPGQETCDRCHVKMAEWDSPAGLVTYEPEACALCHLGETVPGVFGQAPPAGRTVPAFPHKVHLTKKALDNPVMQGRRCTACHGPETGVWGTAAGFKKDVLTCIACHDHKPDSGFAITGAVDTGYVASCATCHGPSVSHPDRIGNPKNRHVAVTWTQPAQRHPEFSETPCRTCHVHSRTSLLREPGQGTKVDRMGSVHKNPNSRPEEAGQCADCHWKEGLADQNYRRDMTVQQLFEQYSKDTNYAGGKGR